MTKNSSCGTFSELKKKAKRRYDKGTVYNIAYGNAGEDREFFLPLLEC